MLKISTYYVFTYLSICMKEKFLNHVTGPCPIQYGH